MNPSLLLNFQPPSARAARLFAVRRAKKPSAADHSRTIVDLELKKAVYGPQEYEWVVWLTRMVGEYS